MKVPTRVRPGIGVSHEAMGYLQPSQVDISPLVRGANQLAVAFRAAAEDKRIRDNKAEEDDKNTRRFATLSRLAQFETEATDTVDNTFKQSTADDTTTRERAKQEVHNKRAAFLNTVDPDLQDEMAYRTAVHAESLDGKAREQQFTMQQGFFNTELDNMHKNGKANIVRDGSMQTLAAEKQRMLEAIDATTLPLAEKIAKKQAVLRDFEGVMYREELRKGHNWRPGKGKVEEGTPAWHIIRGAKELGIDPIDFATLIGYETWGTYSTSQWGGEGGNYLGLIQFGASERQEFGAYPGQPFGEQIDAAVRFAKKRGFKPGSGLYQLYSTVNAGSPGHLGAQDMSGKTVTQHVNDMLNSDYRKQAEKMLGGAIDPNGIDTDANFANLPLEDRQAIRDDLVKQQTEENAARRKQTEEQYNTNYNNLLVDLNDGKAGSLELDAFREVYPGMKFEDINRAQTIIDEREKDGQVLRSAQAHITGDAPWNPSSDEHKKELNALVGKDGTYRLGNTDQEYFTNSILPMVNKSGDIPTDVAGILTGMIRSQDGKKQLYALDAFSQLEEANPRAYNFRVGEDIKADVDLYRGVKNYLPEKELLQVISGGTTTEQRQAQDMLRKEAQRLLKTPTDPQHVSFDDAIASTFGEWGVDPTIVEPNTRLIMQSEFAAIFEYEMTRGGTPQDVSARAVKQLARKWGTTEVGGIKQIMKFPPDKVGYSPIMGSFDYMTTYAQKELNLPEGTKFSLFSDPQTEREVKAIQSNAPGATPPSYPVVYYDENGVARAAPGPDGKPYRMSFEPPAKDAPTRAWYDGLLAQEEADTRYQQAARLYRMWAVPAYNALDVMPQGPAKEAARKEFSEESQRRQEQMLKLHEQAYGHIKGKEMPKGIVPKQFLRKFDREPLTGNPDTDIPIIEFNQ